MKMHISICASLFSAVSLLVLCGTGYAAPMPSVPADSIFAAYAENGVTNTATYREICKLAEEFKPTGRIHNAFMNDVAQGKICGKEPQWVVFSLGMINRPEADDEQIKFPAMSYALRIDVTAAETKDAIVGMLRDMEADESEYKFEEITSEDFAGYKLVFDNEQIAELGIVPCFASVGGKVLVFASSENALASTAALYTGKAASNQAFASLVAPLGKDQFGRGLAPSVGALVKKLLKDDELETLNGAVDGVADLLTGLGNIKFVSSVDDVAKAFVFDTEIEAGSAESAQMLQEYCITAKTVASVALSGADDDSANKELKDTIKGFSAKVEGNVCKIRYSLSVEFYRALAERARKTQQTGECIHNLLQIEGAIEQAHMSNIGIPTDDDIYGPDKYIKVKPVCPYNNAPYVLPAKEGESVKCPNIGVCPDHKLPDDIDDEF